MIKSVPTLASLAQSYGCDWAALSWACRDFLFSGPSMADFIRESRDLGKLSHRLTSGKTETPIRLAILGDCTTQAIAVSAPIVAASLGMPVEIYEAPYDSWRHELLDRSSKLYRFAPEMAIMVITENTLRPPSIFANKEEIDEINASVQATIDLCVDQLDSLGCREILWHNLASPSTSSVGRLDRGVEWSAQSHTSQINRILAQRDGDGLRVIDVATLASQLGNKRWRDERFVHHSKSPFNPACVSDYARALRGTMAAVWGRNAKVLVTDLDDTLWSGIVGDVGPEGVLVGMGTPIGEAHLAYAQYLKTLRMSGVLLAINSRNDPSVVAEAFVVQKGLPLKINDFASVKCHWGAKSKYILEIAEDLNVAPDSLVFVDDDPFQRAEVRNGAPGVSVVSMPEDPSMFALTIDDLHLFDRLALTNEDAGRADTYRGPPSRVGTQASSLEEYLGQAEMIGEFRCAKKTHLPRIEQLFSKTNQFNLTQRRFSAKELANSLARTNTGVYIAELVDRHANYGIVSAVVAERQGAALIVHNWVISCRVFSRGFEAFILNHIRDEAARQGAVQVEGDFVSTQRNGYAKDALIRLGLLPDLLEQPTSPWTFPITDSFDSLVQQAAGEEVFE